MKIAIMQPYFFPYLGYFQLINAVDKFVVYDNIQFTKKGWFNRNRLLFNGKVDYFSINIAKGSDYLDVCERKISNFFFQKESSKILRKIEQNYKKAPQFDLVFSLISMIFKYNDDNLFNFLYNSLIKTLSFLEIEINLITSSTLLTNQELKNQERVMDICKYLKAKTYINPIGGIELYDKDVFKKNEINLHFLKSELPNYPQLHKGFIPGLSIIDVMMFNSVEEIKEMLKKYKLF